MTAHAQRTHRVSQGTRLHSVLRCADTPGGTYEQPMPGRTTLMKLYTSRMIDSICIHKFKANLLCTDIYSTFSDTGDERRREAQRSLHYEEVNEYGSH
jgi:hypothetical protein